MQQCSAVLVSACSAVQCSVVQCSAVQCSAVQYSELQEFPTVSQVAILAAPNTRDTLDAARKIEKYGQVVSG
eukprot:gene20997-biopygen5630